MKDYKYREPKAPFELSILESLMVNLIIAAILVAALFH